MLASVTHDSRPLICSGPVDYSRLPETVQYLRRTQGVLKWRARPGLDCWLSERRFWNRLRYHMPPESSGRSRAGPRVMAQSELVESKSLTSLKVESETSSQAWTECGVTLLDRPEYCG
uniref:Uncharacterized protein n=1 Tax=Knipowitschia caucasica TaxID=637954 RepID=A0AAV2JWA9_KNICA